LDFVQLFVNGYPKPRRRVRSGIVDRRIDRLEQEAATRQGIEIETEAMR
jgi:hypothetical protein